MIGGQTSCTPFNPGIVSTNNIKMIVFYKIISDIIVHLNRLLPIYTSTTLLLFNIVMENGPLMIYR
jgi:hypothetical protein